MAYVGKHFDKASYRTYCLIGDGESMEGNIWEAINFAGFYQLDNLCAIIDVNRSGLILFKALIRVELECLLISHSQQVGPVGPSTAATRHGPVQEEVRDIWVPRHRC